MSNRSRRWARTQCVCAPFIKWLIDLIDELGRSFARRAVGPNRRLINQQSGGQPIPGLQLKASYRFSWIAVTLQSLNSSIKRYQSACSRAAVITGTSSTRWFLSGWQQPQQQKAKPLSPNSGQWWFDPLQLPFGAKVETHVAIKILSLYCNHGINVSLYYKLSHNHHKIRWD